MKKLPVALIVLLLSSCSWNPPEDWNVRAYLTRAGYRFTVDTEGDFIVTIHLSAGRTQKVWIRSKVNHYQGSDIREVFSLALEYKGEIPPALLQSLMTDSYKNRLIGSWVVIPDLERKVSLVAFLAKVQGRMSSSLLLPALLEVAAAADQLELLKSGSDRF